MRDKLAFHLFANLLILAVAYYWLTIPESRALTLTWSILIALIALTLASLTYTASFLEPKQWRTILKNALPVAAAALAIALVYWLLAKWNAYSPTPTFKIASWLTLKTRKPFKPASFLHTVQVILWTLRWIVLPVLFMPLLAAVASNGWQGFRSIRWRHTNWRYWIEVPLLLLCCLRLPLILIYWVPPLDGFFLQSASVALRFLIAYLLFGIAWLVLAGRSKPTPAQ